MTAPNPIKAARQRLKLTQVQLAPRLGVDPATVSRWERLPAADVPAIALLALQTLGRRADPEPPPARLPHPCAPLTAALLSWDREGIRNSVVYSEGRADAGEDYADAVRHAIAAGWTGYGIAELLDSDAGRYYAVLAVLAEHLRQFHDHDSTLHSERTRWDDVADRIRATALAACLDPRTGREHGAFVHPVALNILNHLSRTYRATHKQVASAWDYRRLGRLFDAFRREDAGLPTTTTED